MKKMKIQKLLLLMAIMLFTGTGFAQTALSLDGTDDRVMTSSNIIMGTSWTYETWVKANETTSVSWSGIIATVDAAGATGASFQLCLSSTGSLRWQSNTGAMVLSLPTVINDNTWHHVAIACDGADLVFYVDGNVDHTIPYVSLTMNRKMQFMVERGPSAFTRGEIDRTMAWDHARTQLEIQSDMTSCLTGAESGLVFYYDYEDGAGSSTITDISGGNDGVLTDMDPATDWVANGSLTVCATPTNIGNALNFDGVNDHVDLGTSINQSFDQITIEAWVKHDNTDSETIWGRGAGNGHIHFSTSGHFQAKNAVAGYIFTAQFTAITPDNQWHHWAAVYDKDGATDADKVKIFLDGSPIVYAMIRATTGEPVGASVEKTLIGKSTFTDADAMTGSMDEVRLWDVARSQADINTGMANYLAGSEAGLVAYYRMDQGNVGADNTGLVNEVIDYTGNCNKGTLTNFALTGATSNWVNTGSSEAPILTSTAVSSLSLTSADLNSTIFSTGGSNSTIRGFCYSTSDCPTVSDILLNEAGSFGTGAYSLALTGLTQSTTYFYRAYSTNTEGTSYGEIQTFTTLTPTSTVWETPGAWSNGAPTINS